MATERWLTLPNRAGLRSDDLMMFVQDVGKDYQRAWDTCQEPRFLIEMAAAAGLPVDTVLLASSKCCADAWNDWSGGATDARPMQVINAITRWAQRGSGFEDIWAAWELAEQVNREVRLWYEAQQGAVLATAIANCVAGVQTLAASARDLAEPEEGHDQYDLERYRRKNADAANAHLVHELAKAVALATTAGSFHHSHTEPKASQEAHEGFAHQILGFTLRQHLDADAVVQGLRDRLR